jgi:hypothetical protein
MDVRAAVTMNAGHLSAVTDRKKTYLIWTKKFPFIGILLHNEW